MILEKFEAHDYTTFPFPRSSWEGEELNFSATDEVGSVVFDGAQLTTEDHRIVVDNTRKYMWYVYYPDHWPDDVGVKVMKKRDSGWISSAKVVVEAVTLRNHVLAEALREYRGHYESY